MYINKIHKVKEILIQLQQSINEDLKIKISDALNILNEMEKDVKYPDLVNKEGMKL